MCLQCEIDGLTAAQAEERHRKHTSEFPITELEATLEDLEALEGPHTHPTHRFTEEEMDIIVRWSEREAKRNPQG